MSPAAEPRLYANHVSLSYFDGDQTVHAVRDITIGFPDRGLFGIMGPSGSGKSSLLYLLSGLKVPTRGSVSYAGIALSEMEVSARERLRRQKFGFIFQQPYLLGYLTAHENVLVAAPQADRTAGRRVDALLEELGMADLRDRFPAHLSGGERQRLIVARAMINRPELIFADEPTAFLDHAHGRAVIDLLDGYRDRGAVIIVTHDASMLTTADRVYDLRDGALCSNDDLTAASGPDVRSGDTALSVLTKENP